MQNPKAILEKLNTELMATINQVDKSIEVSDFTEVEINQAIDYLNDAIRKLDHTVEHLISCKSRGNS